MKYTKIVKMGINSEEKSVLYHTKTLESNGNVILLPVLKYTINFIIYYSSFLGLIKCT